MNATAFIKVFAATWLTLGLWACDTASELSFEGDPPPSAHTIADLKGLCKGITQRITQDITIAGVVTANDCYGEFRKMLVVEDPSGGISVLIDDNRLVELFPFGVAVSIHCNGLALGKTGGKVQLGALPTGEYSVDRIPASEIGRYIRVTGSAGIPQAIRLSLNEVSAQHIDRYIRFDNIRFTTEGPWCNVNEETLRPEICEREIADTDGRTFVVRIPGSCIYATEPVPFGTGSMGGIVDYFNGEFSLRITNRNLVFRQ